MKNYMNGQEGGKVLTSVAVAAMTLSLVEGIAPSDSNIPRNIKFKSTPEDTAHADSYSAPISRRPHFATPKSDFDAGGEERYSTQDGLQVQKDKGSEPIDLVELVFHRKILNPEYLVPALETAFEKHYLNRVVSEVKVRMASGSDSPKYYSRALNLITRICRENGIPLKKTLVKEDCWRRSSPNNYNRTIFRREILSNRSFDDSSDGIDPLHENVAVCLDEDEERRTLAEELDKIKAAIIEFENAPKLDLEDKMQLAPGGEE